MHMYSTYIRSQQKGRRTQRSAIAVFGRMFGANEYVTRCYPPWPVLHVSVSRVLCVARSCAEREISSPEAA